MSKQLSLNGYIVQHVSAVKTIFSCRPFQSVSTQKLLILKLFTVDKMNVINIMLIVLLEFIILQRIWLNMINND